MGKPFRIYTCPACARRRRIYERRGRDNWKQLRCSQGHEWAIELGRLERIIEVTKALVLPALVDHLTRDNPFYARVKREADRG